MLYFGKQKKSWIFPMLFFSSFALCFLSMLVFCSYRLQKFKWKSFTVFFFSKLVRGWQKVATHVGLNLNEFFSTLRDLLAFVFPVLSQRNFRKRNFPCPSRPKPPAFQKSSFRSCYVQKFEKRKWDKCEKVVKMVGRCVKW